MKYIYAFLFTAILSSNLQSQGNINGAITGATQQALIDFGNKSSRAPQPLNVQGTHYFDANFNIATLEYFGKELNDTGYMRYNAFRDEIEMADTPSQSESEIKLMKSAARISERAMNTAFKVINPGIRQCDAVAETESEASDSELSKIAKSSGFKIEQTVIEAEGVCHICTDS